MNEKRIFISVLITSFFGPFMASSVNVAIPYMASEYGLNVENLTWILTLFLLGAVCFLLPWGKYADIKGRKKVYEYGCIGVIITTTTCIFASSLNTLLLLRFMQGVCMSMNFATGMAMLIASHPATKRGHAIGFCASCVYMGLSLGPVIGGAFTEFFGWRAIFIFTAIGLTISVAIIIPVHKDWYGNPNDKFDIISAVLYATSASSILYGFSSYIYHPTAKLFLLGGIIICLIFIRRQAITQYPLVKLSLFKNTVFAMSNLAALINYSATFGISFVVSLYLQIIRDFTPLNTGMVLLLQPIMMSLLSPIAGSLSDKYEPRVISSIGMSITAFGLFLLSLINDNSSLYYIGSVLLFIGIGFALFSSPNNNAIMSSVSKNFYGIASSILAAMRMFGQTTSMAIVNLLLSIYTTGSLISSYNNNLLAGIKMVLFILSIICSIGIFCSIARGKKSN
ncbi:MFS transporter [Pectinatus sottacetonis]|uniref:MFS transporter n=1 Tax=Pectinatus sottacetonis TaxID=1002795 RepID=UPI0018C678E8|nr:MFS transporter [Pectinatus sottacetonis]